MQTATLLTYHDLLKYFPRGKSWIFCHSNEIPGHIKIGKSHFWDKEILLAELRKIALHK